MHELPLDSSTRRKLRAAALGTFITATFAGYALGENGQISPSSIEIDGDMIANTAALVQGVELIDWIADTDDPNAGVGCLGDGGVVLCNEPEVTARTQGTGTWNGVRIIDGLSDNDDTYLGGSKFDDISSWIVGTGNVGSSKNDANEVYLANNDEYLYFAMTRLGNNGTTAFDFEFNREAPNPDEQSDPERPYLPNRSPGDILLVFELSGSGKSGSVAVSGYEWDGAAWIEFTIPADTLTQINETSTDAPPWGIRNSKQGWGASDLPRFTFAEVGLPTGANGIELPIDPTNCSQSAWVSIRTRASKEFTSDMKDAFEIVNYEFSGLKVAAAKTGESAANLTMTVTGIIDGNNPAKQWQVFNDQTQTWQDIVGQTDTALTLAYDDAVWTYPHATTSVLDTPFSVAGQLYVGHVITTQVRLAATQTTGNSSCTLNSNGVTLKKLVAVDP